jgi:hypothetical protein
VGLVAPIRPACVCETAPVPRALRLSDVYGSPGFSKKLLFFRPCFQAYTSSMVSQPMQVHRLPISSRHFPRYVFNPPRTWYLGTFPTPIGLFSSHRGSAPPLRGLVNHGFFAGFAGVRLWKADQLDKDISLRVGRSASGWQRRARGSAAKCWHFCPSRHASDTPTRVGLFLVLLVLSYGKWGRSIGLGVPKSNDVDGILSAGRFQAVRNLESHGMC